MYFYEEGDQIAFILVCVLLAYVCCFFQGIYGSACPVLDMVLVYIYIYYMTMDDNTYYPTAIKIIYGITLSAM